MRVWKPSDGTSLFLLYLIIYYAELIARASEGARSSRLPIYGGCARSRDLNYYISINL